MNTAAKLGAYALGLAVVFAGALGIGNAVGAIGPAPAPSGHATHESAAPAQPVAESLPGGLQISQGGYTLTPESTTITPGKATDFRFKVTGPDGAPVTEYQVKHDKKLHFIVADRGLGTFQHLHPTQTGAGDWSVTLTLPTAGAYRAFADFAPENSEGLTLGTDLFAPGDYTPTTLPTADRMAEVDGYAVELQGDLTPGTASKLTLKVTKDGRPVTDLQPYLGAYGHLVALRAGDLAYLHVHPDGAPGDGKTAAGPEITFYAEVPSRGDYRLFLDFQRDEIVRTASFTAHTEQAQPSAESGQHPEHDAGH